MEEEACFFVREKDGHSMVLMENSEGNWNRIRRLACTHRFETAVADEVLMIRQGLPDKHELSSQVGSRMNHRKGILVRGGEEEVSTTCSRCPEFMECWDDHEGPIQLAPSIWNRGARTVDVMKDQMRDAMLNQCLVMDVDDSGYTGMGTIRKNHLESIGFVCFNRQSFFGGADPVNVQGYRDAIKKGIEPSDIEGLKGHVDHDWVKGVLDEGWSKTKVDVEDMTFDLESIRALAFVAKMKGSRNKKKMDVDKAFRKRECSRCVYECKGIPWDKDAPCALELGDVLEQSKFQLNKRELLWLAAFTISGEGGKFVNTHSGRRVNGIGYAPQRESDGSVSMLIKRTIAPYSEIDHISLTEYWGVVRSNDYPGDDDLIDRLPVDEPEKLAVSHWMLEHLVDLTRHHDRRFHGGYAHSKRNDILSIDINERIMEIRIGSDTKATNSGGFGSSGGSHISADERPRFHTHYPYPYFTSVFDWMGQTPGTRGGYLR